MKHLHSYASREISNEQIGSKFFNLLKRFVFGMVIFFSAENSFAINGTKNIPGDYPSLDAAIADLNLLGVDGAGVTFNLLPGNPQTAPAGGYVIGGSTAHPSVIGNTSSTPILFIGNGNTITAPNPQALGSLVDGIFKLIGADFVTIEGFTMIENTLNTVATAASNNMTEFGVALFYVTTSNGSQSNTIKTNTISLNRNYQNTYGIYSNTRHTSTVIATVAEVTSAAGANSNNKVYTNAISNVKYGIVLIGSGLLGSATVMDVGNDIGGPSLTTGNTITNWGAGVTTANSSYVSVTGSNCGIFANQQLNENVSFNTISSASLALGVTCFGILKNYSVLTPAAGTATISNYRGNVVTVVNNPISTTAGTIVGVSTQGITTLLPTATMNIENNTVQNCILGGSTSTTVGVQCISNFSAAGTVNILNNTVQSNSITSTTCTTGSIFGILCSGSGTAPTINSTNVVNVKNNSILNNNNTSAITTGTVIGIQHQTAAGNTAANIQDNIIQGSTLSNAPTATGNLLGISNSTSATVGTLNITGNQISGFMSTTTGQVTGVINFSPVINAININNNLFGTTSTDFLTRTTPMSGAVFAVVNAGGAVTSSLSISNNTIQRIRYIVPATSSPNLISNQGVTSLCSNININNNMFDALALNTSGSVFMIGNDRPVTATGSKNINNNKIVTSLTKSVSGGIVQFYSDFSTSPAGSTVQMNNNDFSNINVVGATEIAGWVNQDGNTDTDSPVKNFNNNTFNNITSQNGDVVIANFDFSNSLTATNNTFTNITSQDTMFIFNVGGTSNFSKIEANTFSNITSTGTAGVVSGLNVVSSGTTGALINKNTFTNIQTAGPAIVFAIQTVDTCTISNNEICGITGSNLLSRASGLEVFDNANIFNNRISSIFTPNADGFNRAIGINIRAGEAITAYHNTVLMSGTSSAPFFGSSALFIQDSINITMNNNILINNGTPTGGGRCAAYKRSGTNLSTYNISSNNNDFFGSTIFADSTAFVASFATFQALVAPREANSISSNTVFLSTSCGSGDFLKVDPAGTPLENNAGTPIVSVLFDFENDPRSGTTPDIGADEFGSGAALALTMFIEGYMNGAVMRPVLLNSSVPGATSTQCDTIVVQLRNSTPPHAVAHSFTGVVGINGQLICSFPSAAIGPTYYIAIQHRSALETWSKTPQAMSASSTYNFASAASQAYGDNMVALGAGGTAPFGLYSGDIDNVAGDGVIDNIDYPLWETDFFGSAEGYFKSDLNGDGVSDNIDYPYWETNFFNSIEVQKP
jgi:hypothetical protein